MTVSARNEVVTDEVATGGVATDGLRRLGGGPPHMGPAPRSRPVTVDRDSAAATRQDEIAEGLAHLSAVDPVIAALIEAHPGYDHDAWRAQLPAMDLFGCLVFQVVGQQISMTAAGAITGRLMARSGGRTPSPEQLSTLDEATLREMGVSWRKAATLRDLAASFVDGRLSEEGLVALGDEEVVAELTEVPGIGPWTVHGALVIHLHRADVVATGDVMLQAMVRKHYGLDHRPTEQEFTAIAQPWHPTGAWRRTCCSPTPSGNV